MPNTKKHFEVVAAVISRIAPSGATQIFAAQRPGPKPNASPNETNYKWEFPGGKIEPGETLEAALAREIKEEFGAEIIVGDFIITVHHEYNTFSITMHAFYCTLARPSETLTLREHLASKWLSRNELMSLDWAAADVAIAEKIGGDWV